MPKRPNIDPFRAIHYLSIQFQSCNMRNLLLLFIALAFFACNSTTSTDSQSETLADSAQNNAEAPLKQIASDLDKMEPSEEVDEIEAGDDITMLDQFNDEDEQ